MQPKLKKRSRVITLAKRPVRDVLDKIGVLDDIRKFNIKRKQNKLNKEIYPRMRDEGYALTPDSFIIELTSKCNLKCQMCWYNFPHLGTITKDLDTEGMKAVIDKITPYVNRVVLTGGEIFVRKDIYEILDHLRARGILIHLTTNGTLIQEKDISRLAANPNITHIGISIDGTKDLHNKIRGIPNSFERSMKNIKLLRQHFPVNIICVVQEDNLEHLHEIVQVAHSVDVKDVYFEFLRIYTKADVDDMKSKFNMTVDEIPILISDEDVDNKLPEFGFAKEDLKRNLAKARAEGKRLGVNIHFYPSYFEEKMDICFDRNQRKTGKFTCAALSAGRIDAEGNYVGCFVLRKKLGSLAKNSLEESWNSEEYRKFRRDLLQGNLLPLCENCLYMVPVKDSDKSSNLVDLS